jgi:hypothetical protein
MDNSILDVCSSKECRLVTFLMERTEDSVGVRPCATVDTHGHSRSTGVLACAALDIQRKRKGGQRSNLKATITVSGGFGNGWCGVELEA